MTVAFSMPLAAGGAAVQAPAPRLADTPRPAGPAAAARPQPVRRAAAESGTQGLVAGAAAALGGALVAARRCRGRRTAQVGGRRSRTVTHVATLDAPKTILREDIRNIAIIAHVDHGKTTLTDALMRQTSELNAKKLASMDSNQIEAERGITILAKNAAIKYKGIKINLIDTPGHADFGGEVERILNMADACLLLVDAQEGPMPQTKFVLRQALKLQRRVIVCINKVDKAAARPEWVLDTTFDLFSNLGASDELCDFPVVYASGFKGMASRESAASLKEDLKDLLDVILEECPKPKVEPNAPLQMLVSNLDYDDYIGRISIGRVISGSLKVGQEVGFMYGPNSTMRKATVTKLWEFFNNERREVPEIKAGDIGAFSGMNDVMIGDTVVDISTPMPLPPIVVEEPTVVMEFGVNSSPLQGKLKESTKLTAAQIKARLDKEVLTNLALRVEPGSTSESFRVKGRGTLQLGILIENMRREGFELMIGPPEVILRQDPNDPKKKQEPYEEAVIEVPKDYQGVILEEMNRKGAELKSMEDAAVETNIIMTFEIPTRNLIGMQGKFMQRTKGMAVMNSQFSRWGPYSADAVRLRERGSLVSSCDGKATDYVLRAMKTKGQFFVEHGDEVYTGMCVGIHNKETDLEINIAKEKKVSNVRAKGEQQESIPPKLQMTIDDFLGHMDVDERLEVTPGPLRLCKKPKPVKNR